MSGAECGVGCHISRGDWRNGAAGRNSNDRRNRCGRADHSNGHDRVQHALGSVLVVPVREGDRYPCSRMAPPAESSMKGRLRASDVLVSLGGRRGALVALVLVFCLAAARYEAFLRPENLVNVLRQNSMLGLVALGMTFVILTGGIDLSAGALVAVAGIAAAFLSRYGAGVA